MPRSLYTVTFFSQDGSETVSQIFERLPAARKWAKWLATRSYVASARVYRGQAGEEVVA